MHTRLIRLLAALLALSLIGAACGDDDTSDATAAGAQSEDAPEDTEQAIEEDQPGTVVDVAVANGSLTTLVAAVQAAGLVDTLSGDGPFTVLAPTDDAFAEALDALGLTADELFADTELLKSVLTYHVIPGEVPSSQVVTLDGQTVAASNGVIHVIDTILLPPS